MKNEVQIYFDGQIINVNGELLNISPISLDLILNKLPTDVDFSNTKSMGWSDNMGLSQKGFISLGDGTSFTFDEGKYNDCIQPYVDIWQAEKDRIQQEQEEAEREYQKFENRKDRALQAIRNDYQSVLAQGFVRTSLGLDADISPDSTATLLGTEVALSRQIRLKEAENPTTPFRDFYDIVHELNQTQIELVIVQINRVQNHLRESKNTFLTNIKNTYDNTSLDEVIAQCIFTTLDYSNLDEQGQPTILPFISSPTALSAIDNWY